MTRLSIEKGRKPCATQAPDPRSRKSKDNALDVEGQTDLLQHGYSIAGLTSLTGPTPSRGRPVSVHKTYRFESCISTINGKTLDEVAKSLELAKIKKFSAGEITEEINKGKAFAQARRDARARARLSPAPEIWGRRSSRIST